MKYLVLFSFMMTGCLYNEDACYDDLENCKLVTHSNLRSFHDQCQKLSKCMKSTFEIVHFNNQPHNPYACSITIKGKTMNKNRYLYPTARLDFGQAYWSGLSNEIEICELMTETGSHSDEYYKSLDEAFKKLDKERKNQNKPKPLPPMKIREEV